MSNLYTIEDLLIGKIYKSRTLVGEIVSAEETHKVCYGAEANAYLVRVRELDLPNYHYRYVSVSNGDI